MARRRRSGHLERPAKTEREVLWDVVQTVSRWKSELPSESALMTLFDGFEALTARLLKAPPDEFNRVLSEEQEVFKRARQEKRDRLDRNDEEAS
jgi:hypothetical protein